MPAAARPPLAWGTDELQAALARLCPGLEVRVEANLASTNTSLLDACRTSPTAWRAPVLLVAEHQSGGRGRQGRVWASEPGASLTCSLAWPLRRVDFSGLSLAVGVALAEAIDPPRAGAARIGVKWPNDLWLLDAEPAPDRAPGRKFGGVLIETVAQLAPAADRVAVIGIGLNVLPLAVTDPSSGVACLHELDAHLTAPLALQRIAAPLLRALAEFEASGFAGFKTRYAARDLLYGRPVQAGAHSGMAGGVTADGALQLNDGDAMHHIVAGDVSVRLQPRGLPMATPSPAAC